mmetsp:Transcript_141743/g.317499  ORF Transcript_141743/g.317499 Transcript_141743/m.317499 type:complete len:207 (+) Transcript_141743:249-869(+)
MGHHGLLLPEPPPKLLQVDSQPGMLVLNSSQGGDALRLHLRPRRGKLLLQPLSPTLPSLALGQLQVVLGNLVLDGGGGAHHCRGRHPLAGCSQQVQPLAVVLLGPGNRRGVSRPELLGHLRAVSLDLLLLLRRRRQSHTPEPPLLALHEFLLPVGFGLGLGELLVPRPHFGEVPLLGHHLHCPHLLLVLRLLPSQSLVVIGAEVCE